MVTDATDFSFYGEEHTVFLIVDYDKCSPTQDQLIIKWQSTGIMRNADKDKALPLAQKSPAISK